MKHEINTYKYEAAYCKKPRGFGRWAFGTKDNEILWMITGTYAAAKKEAIAKANAELKDFETIYVLS